MSHKEAVAVASDICMGEQGNLGVAAQLQKHHVPKYCTLLKTRNKFLLSHTSLSA
jgi:hypothetical protein